MSTSTTNLGLTKPADGEHADISDINGNMDTLDEVIGDVDVSTDGDLQSQITALQDSVSDLTTIANTSIVTDWSFSNLASLGAGNYLVKSSTNAYGWMNVMFVYGDRLGALVVLDNMSVYATSGTESNFAWVQVQ